MEPCKYFFPFHGNVTCIHTQNEYVLVLTNRMTKTQHVLFTIWFGHGVSHIAYQSISFLRNTSCIPKYYTNGDKSPCIILSRHSLRLPFLNFCHKY